MIIPDYDHVLAAHRRIAPYIHRTPVLGSRYLDKLCGATLLFKCENFQKAGAFKARGACNAVFGLDEATAARGVTTHSSGNHAGALSYAAGRRGIPATVVMPRDAPRVKREAVLDYGARVIECESGASAREAALNDFVAQSGAEFVHPYNDPRVIAGQGSCVKELLEDHGPLDAVLAPIGGGGLMSGTCLTLSQTSPETRIYAAEPLNADDAHRSLKAGHIIADNAPQTVADGLRTPLKELTWYFVSRHVSDVLTATEEEIIQAMKLTWQRMKILIEPSSAVTLAVILKNPEVFVGQRVGVIISGGNVDLDRLPWQSASQHPGVSS